MALFDIVNFTLYTPLEQVTQLNSLAYSVNAAHSKMLTKEIDISFARSTTGDGFYIWNRDRSIQANVNLYHFMHLVLADNAIARRKSKSNATPLLRTCFHLGGHYEFYQSEGLSPTIYSYIVGDVTIELARMIDRAMPGQVMVGDFRVPMPDLDTGLVSKIDTVEFIKKTQENLSSLKGLVLSGDEIESIKCYLTGEKTGDGAYSIAKYLISDKHGRTRNIYNAKINIYRKQAEPHLPRGARSRPHRAGGSRHDRGRPLGSFRFVRNRRKCSISLIFANTSSRIGSIRSGFALAIRIPPTPPPAGGPGRAGAGCRISTGRRRP